ncbi:hypothetical protein ACN47E_000735 [Coniothyrium glycines]
MLYQPPGTPVNMITSAQKNELESWINGGHFPEHGPHESSFTAYGCTITKDFWWYQTSTSFKEGMQAQCLSEATQQNKTMVLIYIPGVTEHVTKEGHTVQQQWIPATRIRKGVPLRSDTNSWPIRSTVRHWNIQASQWTKNNPPDKSMLGRTITKLIEAIHTSAPAWLNTNLKRLLETQSIASISNVIVQGTKDARLYDILNKPDFTCNDIIVSARHIIDSNYKKSTAGVYLRWHLSSSELNHRIWSSSTQYIYVGKSIDLRSRFHSHPSGTTIYSELNQGSKKMVMPALCVMTSEDAKVFAHLVEQVFVCLLGSYQECIFAVPTGAMGQNNTLALINLRQAAAFFNDVSGKVFAQTGWISATSRKGFGVANGANWSSPLLEWNSRSEQTLLIRTDSMVNYEASEAARPMAAFRRLTPLRAVYSKGKSALQVFTGPRFSEKSNTFKVSLVVPEKDQGLHGPEADAPYHFVIEVLLDGSPHPHSWSRLPEIGRFKNWNQARSLAVRIEWEYPQGSGKWFSRFVQKNRIWASFEPGGIPGAMDGYSISISILQWLFDATPNHDHAFIPRCPAQARVLQVHWDIHNQEVVISQPKPMTMHSGDKVSANSVVTAMENAGLLNVNAEWMNFTGNDPRAAGMRSYHIGSGNRSNCDTCTLFLQGRQAKKLSCQPMDGNDKLCEPCFLFGRPCCSWTNREWIVFRGQFTEASLKGEKTQIRMRKLDDLPRHRAVLAALISTPKETGADVTGPFTHDFVDMQPTVAADEDSSDDELDEGDFDSGSDDDDAEDM